MNEKLSDLVYHEVMACGKIGSDKIGSEGMKMAKNLSMDAAAG
jgi:hypothetical protein